MGDKMFSISFDKIPPFDEFRDFTFVVDGKAFKIHRIIFAARSEAFANIFKAHPREATIDDISEATFEEIVKFVYTGEVNVTDNNDRKLLAAGERFRLKEVINAVQLHRNLRMNPLSARELETLKFKYDEAKYIYHSTRDRYAVKNPFSEPPNIYY